MEAGGGSEPRERREPQARPEREERRGPRGRTGQEDSSNEERRFVEIAGSLEPVQRASEEDERKEENRFEEEKEGSEDVSPRPSLNSAGDRENPYVTELRKGIEQMKEINKVVYTYYEPVIAAIKINDTMHVRMKDFSRANQSLINKLIIMHDNHTKAILALFPELKKELEIWDQKRNEEIKSMELPAAPPPIKAKQESKAKKEDMSPSEPKKKHRRPSSDRSSLLIKKEDKSQKIEEKRLREEFIKKLDKAFSIRLNVVGEKITRIFAARDRILSRRKKKTGNGNQKRTRGEDC